MSRFGVSLVLVVFVFGESFCSTASASFWRCLNPFREVAKTSIATLAADDAAHRAAAVLPPGELIPVAEPPLGVPTAYWKAAVGGAKASPVADRIGVIQFSSGPHALHFDRESFSQMQTFANTKGADSFVTPLAPGDWAAFLDANYQQRFIASFAQPEKIPFEKPSARNLNRALDSHWIAAEEKTANGKIIVVKNRKTGALLYALRAGSESGQVRLFFPMPHRLAVARRDGRTDTTDLAMMGIESMPDGTVRVLDAAPVTEPTVARASQREKEFRKLWDAALADPSEAARGARSPDLQRAEAELGELRERQQRLDPGFWTTFRQSLSSIPYGWTARSLMGAGIGANAGMVAAWVYYRSQLGFLPDSLTHYGPLPFFMAGGAVVGSLIPTYDTLRNTFRIRSIRGPEVVELERQIAQKERELASLRKIESVKIRDRVIASLYDERDARAAAAPVAMTPPMKFVPSSPVTVEYWVGVPTNISLADHQKLLSLLQRAEALPKSDQKKLVKKLHETVGGPEAAYAAGLQWFAQHYPAPPLQDLTNFLAPPSASR